MYHPDDKIGPYTLVKRLGQGSFGVVWLARDSSSILRDHVALKLPISDEIDAEKMRQEAVLWLRASGHPNILPVIDARLYQDQIAIVTEYVPDGTLGMRLERNGGRAGSVEWAVAICAGILKGLEHLHGMNMVHRDLKPSNVLLDGDTPRLTDFGLVRILRSSARNRPSDGAGTFPYTAPEMFRGAFSEQSDVWAAGVILYQMLAGALPFPQEHHAEIMYAICNTIAPPLPDSVPERIRRIVEQALDRDLDQRFPTARAMREALAPHPASDLLHKSMLNLPSIDATMYIAKASPAQASHAGPAYELPVEDVKQPRHAASATANSEMFGVPEDVQPLPEAAQPGGSTPESRTPSRRKSPILALTAVLAVVAVSGLGASVWLRSHRQMPAPSVQGPVADLNNSVQPTESSRANSDPPAAGLTSRDPGAPAHGETLPTQRSFAGSGLGAGQDTILNAVAGAAAEVDTSAKGAGTTAGAPAELNNDSHAAVTIPAKNVSTATGTPTAPKTGDHPQGTIASSPDKSSALKPNGPDINRAGRKPDHPQVTAHGTTNSPGARKTVPSHINGGKHRTDADLETARTRRRRQRDREAEAPRRPRTHRDIVITHSAPPKAPSPQPHHEPERGNGR